MPKFEKSNLTNMEPIWFVQVQKWVLNSELKACGLCQRLSNDAYHGKYQCSYSVTDMVSTQQKSLRNSHLTTIFLPSGCHIIVAE